VIRHICAQLVRFGWLEARSCAFAAALFAGLAVSKVLADAVEVSPSFPLYRYDALLLYAVLLTVVFRLAGIETGRDLAVIAAFHAVGLAFELVKVRLGSWVYPEPALFTIAGVPLFSGFMYAAVGSYVCRAWRLLRLTVTRYRPRATALVAAAIYVNFLTHQWLPDMRWVLAAALLWVTRRTVVNFTVGPRRYAMPLALSFALIGFFLWLAENVGTYLGAWRYPYQMPEWQPVGLEKFMAWSLLVTTAFTMAATLRPGGFPFRNLRLRRPWWWPAWAPPSPLSGGLRRPEDARRSGGRRAASDELRPDSGDLRHAVREPALLVAGGDRRLQATAQHRPHQGAEGEQADPDGRDHDRGGAEQRESGEREHDDDPAPDDGLRNGVGDL